MKRILSTALAAVMAMTMTAFAQLTARDAFASAPASVYPLLDSNTRLDMIDYFKSGMSTPSANALKGRSAITSLSDKELTVRMTDSSTSQLIVMSPDLVAVISTVATPGLDSKIAFYDSKWNQLPATKYFDAPGIDGWLTAEGKKHADEVAMQVPFMLASYNYDSQTGVLTATNNLDKFLDSDIYSMIAPYLKPSILYSWNGKKFTPAR